MPTCQILCLVLLFLFCVLLTSDGQNISFRDAYCILVCSIPSATKVYRAFSQLMHCPVTTCKSKHRLHVSGVCGMACTFLPFLYTLES